MEDPITTFTVYCRSHDDPTLIFGNLYDADHVEWEFERYGSVYGEETVVYTVRTDRPLYLETQLNGDRTVIAYSDAASTS